MLKWGLLLVMLYALPQTHCSKDWLISTPRKVQAIRRSCVVIPCSYNYKKTINKIDSFTGLWKKETETMIVASKPKTSGIHEDYEGRAQILGRVSLQNCTWMLGGVRNADKGPYFFRLETPLRRYKYSWKDQPTMLEVVGAKGPELRVTPDGALCFVVHNCPVYPPTLRWSFNGTEIIRTELAGSYLLDELHWMIFSVLSFCPKLNSTTLIRCSVTHYGGETASSTVSYH